MSKEFIEYQKQVVKNARCLAKELKDKGFNLITDGTDNHLILVDLSSNNITGKDAEKILDEAYITVNKNTIPFDKNGPFVTSGIRIGTPAITTRGMNEDDMKVIAHCIELCIVHKDIKKAKELIISLTEKYPIYN